MIVNSHVDPVGIVNKWIFKPSSWVYTKPFYHSYRRIRAP